MTDQPALISADNLKATLAEPGQQIVAVGSREAWLQGHIPGASFVPFEQLNHSEPPASGLLPASAQLAELLGEAGIANEHHVIAYDAEHGTKAGRLAFVLDALGHERWSVLDGGLSAWIEAGGEISQSQTPSEVAEFRPGDGGRFVADRDYILSRLNEPDLVVVDTRSAMEFDGTDRRAARGGHIPGAVHFDWVEALDTARAPRHRPESELREVLAARGITPDKEVVLYCQTHNRSSHTYAALRSLGFERVRGYPGAWSDWGNHPDTPVEC